MSDAIKHECGVAMVRLLKPLDYYREKYGDALWGWGCLVGLEQTVSADGEAA